MPQEHRNPPWLHAALSAPAHQCHRLPPSWTSHVLDTTSRMTAPVPCKNNLKGLFIPQFRLSYLEDQQKGLFHQALESGLNVDPEYSENWNRAQHSYIHCFFRLFILLGCWMHFWSFLTTIYPAINQFLYYSALLEHFMQSKTSSKQPTTVLVNKIISNSEALGWYGCIMCSPNPLKQPCSHFRKKLKLLLNEGQTLLFTLSLQSPGKMIFSEVIHFNMATSQLLSSKLLLPQKNFWGLQPSGKCRKLFMPWLVWDNTATKKAFLRHEVLLALGASVMLHPLFPSMLERLTSMGTPHPALPLYRG